jgi:mannuronan 5-epimerase
MAPPELLRHCAMLVLLAFNGLCLAQQQTLHHHRLDALSVHPQQAYIAELLATPAQSLDAAQFATDVPAGRASVDLVSLFSAQAGSWPFEPFVGSGLFRAIADYQAHHPQALLLDNGSLTLTQLAKVLSDPRILQPHKDGYLLSYPLLIGPRGALLVENERLYLNSRAGAAMINRGLLVLRQAQLQSWAGEQSQLSAKSFRPFVMAWAGSTTLIEGSRLARLGHNANLARGLTSQRSREQPSTTPPARILIRASELREMSSGVELHDALALIEDSRFEDLQQYGLDLSASLVSVADNRISGVRNNSGIRLRDGSSGLVVGNLISNVGKSAIEAQVQRGALAVQNNLIGSTGGSAIALSGSPLQPAEGLLLTGNLISNSRGSGIEGQHISRALIVDNRINGSPEYAIRIRNEPALQGEISLLGNQLGNIGKAMIHLQGISDLLLGSNAYQGMDGHQRILDGDLLPVQSLLLETTLKNGCVAHLNILPGQQPSAPLPRAPRCGQSI